MEFISLLDIKETISYEEREQYWPIFLKSITTYVSNGNLQLHHAV